MIVFSNTNSLEVNEGENEIVIEIDPVASEITEIAEVEISTIDGSASSIDFTDNSEGLDFTAFDRTATLNPDNPDSLSFPIEISEDAIAEPTETFQFQVRSPDNNTNLEGVTTIEILDNDALNDTLDEPELEPLTPDLEEDLEDVAVEELLSAISIDDVEQLEGDDNVDFEFTVSLSESSTEAIAVDYITADGSASSEDADGDIADYSPTQGTVEFAPGVVEQTVTVEVIGDTSIDEVSNETFFVNLSNASNARIDRTSGTGTILDDDSEDDSEVDDTENSGEFDEVTVRLEDAVFIEGDEAENVQQLTVNLVDRSGEAITATEDISFNYGTVDISAAANLDYRFINEETAVIASGESSTALDLSIIGDEEIESEESLVVVLADLDPELARFDGDRSELEAVITIQDDDGIAESEVETEIDDTEAEIELLDDAESDETEEEIELEENENTEEETESDDDEELEEIEIELSDDETEVTESDDIESDDIDNEVENDNLEENNSEAELEEDIEQTAENTEEIDVQDSIDNESTSSGGIANSISSDASEIDSSDIINNTVFRFLNSNTGGYLYTVDETERLSLTNNSDNYEPENSSFAGVDPNIDGAEEVYGFFNSDTGGTFYTTSETERNAIIDNLEEFVFEDTAFFAFETETTDTIPVYRFFDSNSGVHLFTADENERSFIEDNLSNYGSEGIAFYALPAETEVM